MWSQSGSVTGFRTELHFLCLAQELLCHFRGWNVVGAGCQLRPDSRDFVHARRPIRNCWLVCGALHKGEDSVCAIREFSIAHSSLTPKDPVRGVDARILAVLRLFLTSRTAGCSSLRFNYRQVLPVSLAESRGPLRTTLPSGVWGASIAPSPFAIDRKSPELGTGKRASRARRRFTAAVHNCEARDSPIPSTAPISSSFRPSYNKA